jgi:phospholipase/carboxylesterase
MMIDGPRMPPASRAKPKQLIVLLHGYGSNGEDLISLAPYWAKTLPDAQFVSPNAPEPVPGYPGGYQWFPITKLDPRLMERALARPQGPWIVSSIASWSAMAWRRPASRWSASVKAR